MKRPAQTCSACGRLWPHPLLYRTEADYDARRQGICSWCAFPNLHRPTAALRQGWFVFDVPDEERRSCG